MKKNKLKNIIPNYKLGTEVDGIIEYRLIPDDTEEEKEVWVDSKGKIRGYVDDGSENDESDESTEVSTELEETDTEKLEGAPVEKTIDTPVQTSPSTEKDEKPKVNVDADSIIVNENVITDDEFFDDFFSDDE